MSDTELLPPVAHIYPQGCIFKTPADIQGKRITVMGLGLNGGGEAAVRFLVQHGAIVTVTDMKSEEALAPTLASLRGDSSLDQSRIRYVLGCHRIEDFSEADCVIKNPGVKYDGNAYLAASRAIETDLSLFLQFTEAPVIAVTGSKGKSSTVSAIYYGLQKAGFTAFLGGNITVSPLTFLESTDSTTPVVLELSSWQLADLRGRKLLRPHISVITKIVPDHQNFYHSMLAYVADKKLIYADQTKNDFTILDFDDDASADGGTLIENWGNVFAKETKASVLRYSKKKLPAGVSGVWQDSKGFGHIRLPGGPDDEICMKELIVPGKHMRLNVLNAALVLRLMGVTSERCIEVLGAWSGIEHRLEFFHEWRLPVSDASSGEKALKLRFYNDSAATVPEAAAEATQAFGEPVIFITGGTDKGLDLSPVAHTISNPLSITPSQTYLLAGSATDKMRADFDAAGIRYKGPFDSLESLLAALKTDVEARRGAFGIKNVVFSPGATSFGMFTNEFDRGRKFKKAVRDLFTAE
ncbi:MAG: UDP-N-acetylmuramoyl-L-alanine--D-glutamate ligase [Treponema sp.]|nr:UDP-N-acetylmuramoyl-L-alanine--D-glutamate ligase [Treponema sp.]